MLNQVALVGRLTRKPELKYTSEGIPVTNIVLAVERSFKNREGEIEADFIQCTLWKRTAENTTKYCQQGSVIGVSGWIQTRNYENKEGNKVYVTEVVAETVKFITSNRKGPTEDKTDPNNTKSPEENKEAKKELVGANNE